MKSHCQKLSAAITAAVLTCLAVAPVFAEYDDYASPDGNEIAENGETAAEDFVLSDDGEGIVLTYDTYDYNLDGLYAATKSTNTYKTVTISANSIESWIKKVKQNEANMTGFGKLVTDASGKQTYTGKVITNRQVLEYKTISVKIPSNKQGANLKKNYKTVKIKLPSKIKYTLHKHSIATKVTSSAIGTFIVGLTNQEVRITQSCDCGYSRVITWKLPPLTYDKVTGGDTYTITTTSASK